MGLIASFRDFFRGSDEVDIFKKNSRNIQDELNSLRSVINDLKSGKGSKWQINAILSAMDDCALELRKNDDELATSFANTLREIEERIRENIKEG